MELLGTSESVHAALLLFIHDSFGVRKELGRTLGLVDEKQSLETLEEQSRGVLRQTAIFQSVQRNVVPLFAPAGLKDGLFVHLTRPCHEQNRKKVADFPDTFFKSSGKIYRYSDLLKSNTFNWSNVDNFVILQSFMMWILYLCMKELATIVV